MPRKRNLYDPNSESPFRLSRSKVDLFLKCRRCFYLDRRLGVSRPPGFPFNLNSAVDHLLKVEFDRYRADGERHPLMVENDIDALPFAHDNLDEWRNNFRGVSYVDRETKFELFGAIDDLWKDNKTGQLIVVDYKATSKASEVTIDAEWQISYKRQMEFYQWLFRQNGFDVSNTGYFVYCNGRRDMETFDARLEFKVKVIPYEGSDEWIQSTIKEIHQTLNLSDIPNSDSECEFCRYVDEVGSATRKWEANNLHPGI